MSTTITMMKQGVLIMLTLMIELNEARLATAFPTFHDTPCTDTNDIISFFSPGLADGYKIQVNRTLNKRTTLRLKFDMEALITVNTTLARKTDLGNNIFKFILLKETDKFEFEVKGQFSLLPPYMISIKINGQENCKRPDFNYFHRYPAGVEKRPDVPNLFCGKRKAVNQLIVNGAVSKPGDWPWHVAMFMLERATLKYICGGTLISNIFILTAAHCVTINEATIPSESLGISLGKHNLIKGDETSQDREVYEIIVHEEFSHKSLNNDIALLKMKTPVKFNSNIQPACIWFDKAEDKLINDDVIGTVTGWGFDQTESLSTVLREAPMPMVSDLECIRSKPLFFSTFLDGTKFCAGYHNGTSACNGDSGGGFFIYVPYEDSPYIKKNFKGAWYVRGIVSLSVAREETILCDPNEYVVFTDIRAYTDWIDDHMD